MAKIKYHTYLKDYVTLTTTAGQPTTTPKVEGETVFVIDGSNKILEHWVWDKGTWKGGELPTVYNLPIYSDDISNVTAVGSDGQFLYITNTGDEFGVIDDVYVWIGGIWSPYPESQGTFEANIRSTSASLALADNDYTVVFTTVGLTATLPTPSALVNSRRIYNIKNVSTGTLNIVGNIDGIAQTITIGAGDSRTFHGNGATWYII